MSNLENKGRVRGRKEIKQKIRNDQLLHSYILVLLSILIEPQMQNYLICLNISFSFSENICLFKKFITLDYLAYLSAYLFYCSMSLSFYSALSNNNFSSSYLCFCLIFYCLRTSAFAASLSLFFIQLSSTDLELFSTSFTHLVRLCQ